MNNRQHFARTSNKGFSLLELLLVLVIVMLLFGAAVFEFNSMGRGASLSEGADQLESLFRFARNEAERTGKNVRIRFGPIETDSPDTSADFSLTNSVQTSTAGESYPIVEWESNPVEWPGQFKPMANSSSFTEGISELVKIESIELAGLDARMSSLQSSLDTPQNNAGDNSSLSIENSLPILHFYPDGSCDSGKVQLADIKPDNLNKIIVELIGYTGTVRHHFVENIPQEISEPDANNVRDTNTPLGQADPAP